MSALERRQQKRLTSCKTLLDRHRWLLSELHAGHEFSKDQLWQWLHEAEMVADLVEGKGG